MSFLIFVDFPMPATSEVMIIILSKLFIFILCISFNFDFSKIFLYLFESKILYKFEFPLIKIIKQDSKFPLTSFKI